MALFLNKLQMPKDITYRGLFHNGLPHDQQNGTLV